MIRQLALFIFLLSLAQSASATGIFDIMNETFFTGNWSDSQTEYNLPSGGSCPMLGTQFVAIQVAHSNKNGDPGYRIYAREYRDCVYKGTEEYGNTICSGDGCWVDMIAKNNMFVTKSLYGAQTNSTKAAILKRCGGVVGSSWTPSMGHPNNPYDAEIQNTGIAWGYVQIHFENMSKINGEYCIPSTESLQIDSGSWETVGDPSTKKKKWVTEFVSIDDKTMYFIEDDIITAKINITVKWRHRRIRGDGSYAYCNHTDAATFYDTAVMPKVLTQTPDASVTIVCYNNSVSPYSLIEVYIDENVTETEITYRNQTATHHHKIGLLETTDNPKHFTFIDKGVWKPDQNNVIAFRAGYYVINEAPLGAIQINVSTPYQTYMIIDYNVTVINSKPTDHVGWKPIIAFMSVLVVFGGGILCILRRYV